MEIVKHTGFDLFFNNMSNEQAKELVAVLNANNCTMKGRPMRFKLNRKHPRYLQHQAASTVITARYDEVIADAAYILLGLTQNRELGEKIAERFGSRVTYEGSEFYCEMPNIQGCIQDVDNLLEEYSNAA